MKLLLRVFFFPICTHGALPVGYSIGLNEYDDVAVVSHLQTNSYK